MNQPEFDLSHSFSLGMTAGILFSMASYFVVTYRIEIWEFLIHLVTRVKALVLHKFLGQTSNVFSPEEMDSGTKISFLLSKMAWIQRQQMRHGFRLYSEKNTIAFSEDFLVLLKFKAYAVHIRGTHLQNGYVIEIGTNDPSQQGARYIEDIGTQVQNGFDSVYRAELTTDEFAQVKERLIQILQ